MSAEQRPLDEEKDAKAFRDGAGAIEALLDAPLEIVPQHAPKRGTTAGACGAFGQVKATGIGVTCPACLTIQAKRAARRKGRK